MKKTKDKKKKTNKKKKGSGAASNEKKSEKTHKPSSSDEDEVKVKFPFCISTLSCFFVSNVCIMFQKSKSEKKNQKVDKKAETKKVKEDTDESDDNNDEDEDEDEDIKKVNKSAKKVPQFKSMNDLEVKNFYKVLDLEAVTTSKGDSIRVKIIDPESEDGTCTFTCQKGLLMIWFL